jgi:hypothetical protein
MDLGIARTIDVAQQSWIVELRQIQCRSQSQARKPFPSTKDGACSSGNLLATHAAVIEHGQAQE